MEPMTQLERFRAFLAREPLDRPLRYASYTGAMQEKLREHLGEDPHAHFAPDGGSYLGLREPEGCERPDFTGYYDADVAADQIDGLGVLRERGDYFHFTHTVSPLRNAASIEEIEAFPIETEEDWDDGDLAAQVADAHERGLFVKGAVNHLYEDSWQIRGYEEFLTDMVTRPEWLDPILDRVMARNIRRAEAVTRAGADVLHTGDDIANQKAMMFRPELWRQVLGRRWERIYAAARAINPDVAIWYHSDGNIEAVIPRLLDIGVTIVNPMQPECLDVERVFAQYGDRALFDGAVGTQSVFPWGTPDEMRATVRRLRDVFGGRLTLSPTHVLEPEVPVENVVAFFEAASEPF